MALAVEYGRLYCTTSEVEFGPEFRDDNEACDFIKYVFNTRGLDPRQTSKFTETLDEILKEMRAIVGVIER